MLTPSCLEFFQSLQAEVECANLFLVLTRLLALFFRDRGMSHDGRQLDERFDAPETLCDLGIGIFNDLFYGLSYIPVPRELSIPLSA